MDDEEIEEDNLSIKHTMSFSYKQLHERIWDFVKIYPKQITKIVTILITGWAIIEILYYDQDNKTKLLILPLLVLALVYSIVCNLKEYNSRVPEILKDESKEIKKIFIKQKIGWQYKIAYSLLKNVTIIKTLEMQRIKSGLEYIEPKIFTINEYIIFLRKQPIGIQRLVKAAKLTCIDRLPGAISKADNGDDKDIIEMVEEINHFINIYSEIINFEKKVYSTIPPEEFEELHRFVFDWTEPILDGMNQFVENLEIFTKIKKKDFKKKDLSVPELTIVFEVHENIDNFTKKVDEFDFETLE